MKHLADILPKIIEFRHRLHRIPELAGQELRTSAAIREALHTLGIETEKPRLGTDIVGWIRGGKGDGPAIALRADIDALAICENTGKPYTSEIPGMMHACGHDGHAAMLLGAGAILQSCRNEFAGSVRLIFQPGEENKALGRDLVAAGVLENPHVDYVAALHGMPGLPVGVIGLRDGASEASCSHFKITIHGRGGHSSRPHLTIDPVITAAALVMEAQSIVSRRIDPLQTGVLSICRITGGTLANVIPDQVVLEGTARALTDEVSRILETELHRVASAVCLAHGATFDWEYHNSYPVTFNTPAATALARRVVCDTLGENKLHERPEPSMGADDFAYYTQHNEGVYVKIGTGENSPGIHTATFDFPDEALENGIRFFVGFALAGLKA